MSLFAQYVGISSLKTMEHFFQFFHIGSGQRVRRLPLLGDIIMGQILSSPLSGTEEKW